ncbi:MAG: hypothetical protein J5947_05320 [Clostridium sp.]|nr:hypothetical protein [Clostridium sp.]
MMYENGAVRPLDVMTFVSDPSRVRAERLAERKIADAEEDARFEREVATAALMALNVVVFGILLAMHMGWMICA